MKILTQRKTANIGIVCSPWLGGSGVIGSELARWLSKDPHYQVVLISFASPFRLNKKEVLFHKAKPLNHALFQHPLNETALVEAIVEAAKIHHLKIIHAHFAIPFASASIEAREILRKSGINIKVVTTLHGTDVLSLGQEVPATLKYVVEKSDAVTSVSDNLAKLAQKICRTDKKIQVIYNFVDPASLPKRPNLALRQKFAAKNRRIFLHISNFRRIKRINDTLRVFQRINKKIPSVLALIGQGPQSSSAKKLARRMKHYHFIRFLGQQKNPYQYLSIADGLILTSEYESFGLVALEAMALGVPVFATRVGGIPELVKHGESGYLAKLGDVDTLAQYVITHFSNPAKIEQMKIQAKEQAANFRAEKIIPQYEQIYRHLTKKPETLL